MKKQTLISFAALFASLSLCAMTKMPLDGLWDFKFEKNRMMENVRLPGFTADDRMIVPGCWNSMSRYYNQHGTACYRRVFTLGENLVDSFLVVEGFALRLRAWVDGREIGMSAQPWSTVEFATGPLAAGEHELVLAVDSTVDANKVKMFQNYYDFYPFGGLYHGVSLVMQRKAVELRKVAVRTRDYKTGQIELEAIFEGAQKPLDFTADVAFDMSAPSKIAFKGGKATLKVPAFRLWSHEDPNLHHVTVAVEGAGSVTERFGIRQVGTRDGRITLNGEKIYIKGVNRHEAHYEFGPSTPAQLMYEDITLVKDLGGNFIRGSHYPQCDRFLSLCDELGILVWEESLGWGNRDKQFKDEEFCKLQEEAARLMARNSINHPCVIISGFLNEPESDKESCKALVDRLIKTIRDEDTGHLVTFACNRNSTDICNADTDIIAYNTYPYWYHHLPVTGEHSEMQANVRRCHAEVVKYFRDTYRDNRPIICSETGVKADYGVRDPRGRSQMSEDFQAEYTKVMLEEIYANTNLAGIAIWQMTDAKTYTRRTGGLTVRSYGVNTGGLFDLYRRPKLSADAAREMFRKMK